MSQAPIGMMDSGYGGLSVWREVQALLPQESILYFADNAHCPYGSKPIEEVYKRTQTIVDFLLEKGCKLIVIACNTATAAAIKQLRAHYEVPFVGMEPALKPAAKLTQSGVIGILATENTFKGDHFHRSKSTYAHDKEVVVQPGFGLVELVENGQNEGEEAREKLRPLLKPMLDKGVDQLVLGCTHYPFLQKEILDLTEGKMNLIDPSPAVANQVKRVLEKGAIMNESHQRPTLHFFTSSKALKLKAFVESNLPQYNSLPKIYEKSWL